MEKKRRFGWLAVVMIIAVMALMLPGAGQAAPGEGTGPTTYYHGGELNFDAFAVVKTTDLNAGNLGAGIASGLFVTEHWGLRASAWSYDRQQRLVDEADASVVYRLTSGPSAIHVLGGGGYDFEHDARTLHVGLGVEHRFTPNVAVFVEGRLEKRLDTGDNAGVGRVGIRAALF